MEEQKIKKQSIIKNKKTVLFILLILGINVAIVYLLSGYDYFDQYCKKESRVSGIDSGIYYCNRKKSSDPKISAKIIEKIKIVCIAMGLKVKVGYLDMPPEDESYDFADKKINGLTCFNIKDGGKECNTGSDCSTGYCVLYSSSCKENCTGSCWKNPWRPPCETENSPSILKDGKATQLMCPW